jgi:hypothetical protein
MAGLKIVALGVLVSIVLAQGALGDPTSQPAVDAFVNLGAGPYPEASALTTGSPLPWYDSPAVASFFGGTPTATQQADFDNTVLQRVQQTFQLSGVPVTLTDNPSVSAPHTLSLVSNASSNSVGNAIGMTDLGANGFSFFDQIASKAKSVDQLEWIVAHNISHELMLAFGVGENFDQTGQFIDARNANFTMMTNPQAVFSSPAAQALHSALATGAGSPPSAEPVLAPMNAARFSPSLQLAVSEPETVPEPATVALWSLAAMTLAASRRFRQRQAASTASSRVG